MTTLSGKDRRNLYSREAGPLEELSGQRERAELEALGWIRSGDSHKARLALLLADKHHAAIRQRLAGMIDL